MARTGRAQAPAPGGLSSLCSDWREPREVGTVVYPRCMELETEAQLSLLPTSKQLASWKDGRAGL